MSFQNVLKKGRFSDYSHKKRRVGKVGGCCKRDALLHKTQQGSSRTELPNLDMCRPIISLSKITNQRWHNYPFSQRRKVTEIAEVG